MCLKPDSPKVKRGVFLSQPGECGRLPTKNLSSFHRRPTQNGGSSTPSNVLDFHKWTGLCDCENVALTIWPMIRESILHVADKEKDAVMLTVRGILRTGGVAPRQAPTLSHSSSLNSSEIVIPQRVERSPTDILDALASTVSRDYTAPHYKVLSNLQTKTSISTQQHLSVSRRPLVGSLQRQHQERLCPCQGGWQEICKIYSQQASRPLPPQQNLC